MLGASALAAHGQSGAVPLRGCSDPVHGAPNENGRLTMGSHELLVITPARSSVNETCLSNPRDRVCYRVRLGNRSC